MVGNSIRSLSILKSDQKFTEYGLLRIIFSTIFICTIQERQISNLFSLSIYQKSYLPLVYFTMSETKTKSANDVKQTMVA